MSILVSVSFSWIKFFRYRLNDGQDELNFPISNELDIFTADVDKSSILDFFFVFDCISNLINYVVIVFLTFVIDLVMMRLLRTTLKEKLARLKTLSTTQQTLDSKCNEFEDALTKNAHLVVFNTITSVFFKLPMAMVPLTNAYAQFYYKSELNRYVKPRFDRFYLMLFESGFYATILDASDLLYLFSLSIQFFVYNWFDKKFKMAKLKLF